MYLIDYSKLVCLQGLDDAQEYLQHSVSKASNSGCHDAVHSTGHVATAVVPASGSVARPRRSRYVIKRRQYKNFIKNTAGEQHPVYDEFGSVFLLILVMRYHFDLQDYDLGISTSKSFVLQYLRNSCVSRDLSDDENELLGNWIKGLFLTEGIGDELMSTCSPKDFHLLVATLFDQSLRACQAGKLGLDALKGGFECE